MTGVGLPPLIPLEEAQERVLGGATPLPVESAGLEDAVGRALARPVTSALTVPPWDNSAMDGFAVRSADLAAASLAAPVILRVLGEIPAGGPADVAVEPGSALRIMTGAMMPAGADAVVPVEDTDAQPGQAALPKEIGIRMAPAAGVNIRRAGSDVVAGAPLLPSGYAIGPAAVALLGATGNVAVDVHRRPRVAVISTGDELVPLGEPLGPARIYDSNGPALAAQARAAGAEVRRFGIAPDILPELLRLLGEAASWADVVVLSGGVSVGTHDHVKTAFSTLGTMALWRVAIKPGRPFAFARARSGARDVALFGLPGNPVSVFVTFELFVRPLLRALGGHARLFDRPVRHARLVEPLAGSPGRLTIARVVLEPDPTRPDGLVARSSGGQDSHMLWSLASANGLAFVPASLPAGADVVAWELGEG
jgi:molybdopterin molybdotransferase